jgi:mannose-1-phosphate guanylyltransferase
MANQGNAWAIVLAAGEGTRLRTLTTDRRGVTTPKQYCSLSGGRSLLQEALRRGRRLVARRRVIAIVAEAHRRWWEPSLAELPRENVVVQPRNRGTAAGVLLPLLSIVARDPEARVVLLPSDHFVEDEDILHRALRRAQAAMEEHGCEVILMGITPDAPEPDYGWIVPAADGGGSPMRVARFVEKPDPAKAIDLMRAGGVWNSFILAAPARALIALYERRLPDLLSAFRGALGDEPTAASVALAGLYAAIGDFDFSRDLLQGSETALRLMPVPPCGWTDLGTPDRVARCLARGLRPEARGERLAAGPARGLSLASAAAAALA